uniref:RanBP-type and C3HC4-type zinc finger-containing protein 1 n=1 Tax=Phlebotomus papatasi TaxID=29031 RepID=A0A1B0D1D0_PHLPP
MFLKEKLVRKFYILFYFLSHKSQSKPFTDSRSSSSSTSSGFSLFRWFRRNERVRSKITPIAEPTDNPQRFNSSETLSPPDSPNLSRGYRSQSSSCDSILSTETTGFAFVPATSYHPIGGLENQVELNLTKKYGLFATDTLKSVKEDAERVDYSDLSLPTPDIPSRSHRRTHSESSSRGRVKVHVKGKRKAPQPPKFTENLNRKSLLENTTVSPASTLGRKKRRAPQPPEVAENAPKSILEGGLLDDKEIQAILGGESPTITESMDRIRMPVADEVGEDVIANDTLKLEKGVLKAIKPIEVKEEAKVVTPSSPISPRPWYKRPLSGNRDTSIPFKKEVILRTVDKRRHRETKEKDNDALPEVNYSRNSSLFDSAKFGLFSRHPTREETKRRSGIGIPNISELDREAAEIVQQEKSRGLSPPQALILRPQMFGSPQSSLDDEDEDGPRKSTKELISKFEASSNGARITLNTSFIGRTDNFVDSRTRVSANEETINKVDGLVNSPMAQKRSIFSDTQSPPNSPIKTHPNDNLKVHGDEKDDKENLKSIGIWTCPYCTLENPNWRILCEVCERIKPYDKRLVNLMEPERKVPTSQQIRQPLAPKPSSPKENWERKAEIVKRYFNPGQGLNSLAKSASETSIGKPPQKRNSPSKLIGSPKFGFRGFMQRSSPEKAKGINEEDSDLEMESSVVSKGRDGTPDLEELRLARLNRFRMEKAVNPLTDRDSLEKEKKRLREMIRAMNAKALAEKYPVIQKAASLDEASSPSKGAIKKTYPNTKLVIEETKKEPDKSTKVSSSAQTGAILKKTPSPEIEEQPQEKPIQATEPIYANLNCQVNHVKFSEVEKAKVDELTEQLKSVKGREEFKATLKFSELSGNTDTLAINKIMKSLELAIVEGQHELAATLAKDLAKMKVSLSVTRQKTRPLSITDIDMKPFMIDLYVEDKVAHKGPLQMSVNSQMTLKELKDKVSKDFSIPIDVQRWILNDQLATDETKKLIDYSIRDSSAVIYLYLVSPPSRKPSHKDPMKYFLAEEDQFSICGSDEEIQNEKVLTDVGFAEDIGATALPIPKESSDTLEKGWPCPLCTLINSPTRLGCGVCSEARPLDYMVPPDYPKPDKTPEVPQEKVDNVILRPLERKNDLNRVNPNRKSAELFNIVQEEIRFKNAGLQTPSPNITKNKYRGVYNYNPSTKYSHQISSQTKKMAPQPPNLHRELLNLDNADIVANIEAFECPICFMKFQPGEGVILRDCLHTFCRECLGHTVEYSEDAQVKCPFMNAVYSCDSVLQDREIKALVTRDVYEKYLAKSVRQAEHKIENAFHCKTPNCRGWCIYEDNVNLFKCPVCRITNCLTCQVIHDGLNCKQYQDRMNSDCDSNVDARRTKEMLETMVDKGEAMKCPTCQVVLMKKWGCDWLKCSMCKTEICWVTRGPRWGPAGKGDTSAGCKCGVDSKKCHPKCNYCH